MTLDLKLFPVETTTLCFDKEEFMKPDFDVDVFVADCRRRVQLETLREDLHIYFRTLKNAMVELINKDYADFVNLSSNLVGMDKAISNLSVPLGQLKEEILSVQNAMDEAIEVVEKKMEERRQIGEKKALLQRLINIEKSVDKMELILKIGRTDTESEEVELTGQQIERVASEFNQLQYYVTQSKGLPLVEKIRPRIASITVTLQHSLEKSFRESLELGQPQILKQCLRTYATIDKMKDAEALFQQVVVKPFMEEIINEGFLQNHPQGLKGLFSKVLEFIPKHCQLIRQVTCASQSPKGEEVVRGYDFPVNSVWPEIASSLESRTPSIFAPGNPDTFHEKYLLAMDFVDKLERQCGTQASVRRLRNHPSFNTFMAKWSLPVYFQLRFQEIAGAFETALMSGFSKNTGNARFKLMVSQVLSECLDLCWDDGIYLPPLCHRFWKLTHQLMSRYSVWIGDIYQQQIVLDKKETKETPEEKVDGQQLASQDNQTDPVTTAQIVYLVTDIDTLTNVTIPSLFTDHIQPKLAQFGCQDEPGLREAFNESNRLVSSRISDLSSYIVSEVCSLSSVHLKAAHDIPRLYRRTNREVPSKPSAYITNALKPIEMFMEEHKETLSESRRCNWVTAIFSSLTKGYFAVSSELLTSVKKMEDSLKRLKAQRKSFAGMQSSSGGMSDDDKIRLQLTLDVRFFGEQIESFGVNKTEIEMFIDLSDLVESAIKVNS